MLKQKTLFRRIAGVFVALAVGATVSSAAVARRHGLAAEGGDDGGAVPGRRVVRHHRPQLAQPLNDKLGQPFVIDNRPGATGAIGATFVKRAPADGYTLLVASIGVYAVNPFLQKNLAYDPAKDFDLLTVAVRAPNVLVGQPELPGQERWRSWLPI